MRLVYLSPTPWASFAQRPHKFVECFHRRFGEKVIWLEPYPTRFPRWADLARYLSPHADTGAKIPAWLQIITPRALPLEPLPGSGALNQHCWATLIRSLKDSSRAAQTLLVIGKPSLLAWRLLHDMRPAVSVYDAMDAFPAFYSGLSRRMMARRERRLARAVSLVWASSSALHERWSHEARAVHLAFNALDPGLLPPPRLNPVPRTRKVFGYVGTIAGWFDWPWLLALAKARPDDLIRLIGPLYQRRPALPGNVELLPPCTHEAALLAMRDFDVGLIPFWDNELTASVDPIKYYEYRAIGLPVLSTAFGEMRRRAEEPGVFLSAAHDDIARLANSALDHRDSLPECAEFVRKNHWQARFDELWSTLPMP